MEATQAWAPSPTLQADHRASTDPDSACTELMTNLVLDPWLPVRRRSGREERIAPWQVTELPRRGPGRGLRGGTPRLRRRPRPTPHRPPADGHDTAARQGVAGVFRGASVSRGASLPIRAPRVCLRALRRRAALPPGPDRGGRGRRATARRAPAHRFRAPPATISSSRRARSARSARPVPLRPSSLSRSTPPRADGATAPACAAAGRSPPSSFIRATSGRPSG